MIDEQRVNPYFDDYDESKQYTQILANPGRVEQAREFTQLQTMVFDFLQRLSDTLYNNGAIVSGMDLSVDKETGLVTVEDGKVYHSGKIHIFKKQTVTSTLSGEEIIGVKLQETIITENEDNTLLDPATNMANYGQAGAHRIKSEPVLTIGDPDASTIYELLDGDLKIAVATPQLDTVTDVLAKRTYDESGNYRVRGLEVNIEPNTSSTVNAVVEVGTAYIKGYDVTLPFPRKLAIPLAKTTRQTTNEPKVYHSGTELYVLNNAPAKQINAVMGTVSVSAETVTRTANDVDYPAHSPVVAIDSIYAGSTQYLQGTDFKVGADGINWNTGVTGAKQPENGASYTVAYKYTEDLVEGTDYTLLTNQVDKWGDSYDYIKIINTSLAEGFTFYVNYEYYLARYDAIGLDKDGNITIISGQPDIPRLARKPVVSNDIILQLGVLYFPPNSPDVEVVPNVITRLTMEDLQHMATRLDHVEYNLAVTSLDLEAMSGENPTEMQGVFSDAFFTTTKGDENHPDFDIMYSLEDGMIMLPFENISENSISISGSSDAQVWGRVVTSPFEEIVAINQPYATTTMKINPYLAFNSLATLKCVPEVDNWIDTETIVVEKTKKSARNFNRWWRHNADNVQYDLISLKTTTGSSMANFRGGIGSKVTAVDTTTTYNTVEEAVTYMRQRQVEIRAENLEPLTANLKCSLDGITVPLTVVSGYGTQGANGTAQATNKGVLRATFNVPANVRTGTREVKLWNDSNTASTSYTAIGTKKTTTQTVLTNYITLTAVDPLAQTFQFDEDTILSAVGIFVATKDAEHNLVVQIRNVVNGYPSNTVYGQTVLEPNQVNASTTGTAETKVRFNDPIYCEAGQQYCIVVETDSPTDSMHICNLGEKDVPTGVLVTRQPYLAGMLFSSKNSLAWTPHQNSNMTFKIYKCLFNPTGTVEFDPILNMSSDTLLLLADSLTYGNTGCTWQVRFKTNEDWKALSTYYDYDLDEIIDSVYLKAEFKSDENMSPIIAIDGFTIVGFLQKVSGAYVCRNVETIDPYTSVKVVYESFEPSGSSVVPAITHETSSNMTWKTETVSHDISDMQDGWKQHTVMFSVPSSVQATNFRVKLEFKAQSSIIRPKVRKLMTVMK